MNKNGGFPAYPQLQAIELGSRAYFLIKKILLKLHKDSEKKAGCTPWPWNPRFPSVSGMKMPLSAQT